MLLEHYKPTRATKTSFSIVESTPSSTTTIEMGSEEEDDCHFNFELKVIFYEYTGLSISRVTV